MIWLRNVIYFLVFAREGRGWDNSRTPDKMSHFKQDVMITSETAARMPEAVIQLLVSHHVSDGNTNLKGIQAYWSTP